MSGFITAAQSADSKEGGGSRKTGTADVDLLENTVRLQVNAFRAIKRIPVYDEKKGKKV